MVAWFRCVQSVVVGVEVPMIGLYDLSAEDAEYSSSLLFIDGLDEMTGSENCAQTQR